MRKASSSILREAKKEAEIIRKTGVGIRTLEHGALKVPLFISIDADMIRVIFMFELDGIKYFVGRGKTDERVNT